MTSVKSKWNGSDDRLGLSTRPQVFKVLKYCILCRNIVSVAAVGDLTYISQRPNAYKLVKRKGQLVLTENEQTNCANLSRRNITW